MSHIIYPKTSAYLKHVINFILERTTNSPFAYHNGIAINEAQSAFPEVTKSLSVIDAIAPQEWTDEKKVETLSQCLGIAMTLEVEMSWLLMPVNVERMQRQLSEAEKASVDLKKTIDSKRQEGEGMKEESRAQRERIAYLESQLRKKTEPFVSQIESLKKQVSTLKGQLTKSKKAKVDEVILTSSTAVTSIVRESSSRVSKCESVLL